MKRILSILLLSACCIAMPAQKVVRLGLVGLDTSHATAFTEIINGGNPNAYGGRYRIVAAYPYGSRVIESSYSRIPGYTEKVKAQGVEICGSIAELLGKVDCVFLETNDGRVHLEQAAEIFKSCKRVFIDKPLGGTLGETIAICELAKLYGVQMFSSSALRFSTQSLELRNGKYGKVLGADCYSPHHPEATHPDFGFYGIHGIESLFTVMGRGCQSVSRTHSDIGDICVGVWDENRLGTFRAVCHNPSGYGGTAFTEKGIVPVGGYEGYKPMLDEILKFFDTGISPIDNDETIEIFTFMKASNMSLQRDGKAVSMSEAYEAGQREAKELIKPYIE